MRKTFTIEILNTTIRAYSTIDNQIKNETTNEKFSPPRDALDTLAKALRTTSQKLLERGLEEVEVEVNTSHDIRKSSLVAAEEIYNSVFSLDIHSHYQVLLNSLSSHEILCINMKISEGLAHYPWELMFYGKNFLALNKRITINRVQDLNRDYTPSNEYEKISEKINVLIICGNDEQLDLKKEVDRIKHALESKEISVSIDILEKASITKIQAKLQEDRYHIIHFLGHGEKGKLEIYNDRGRIVTLPVDQLKNIIYDSPRQPILVWLNSCSSAATTTGSELDNMATILINFGVSAVIANQTPIMDNTAITLADSFYKELVKGHSVDVALMKARHAFSGLNDTLEWATPVLYLRHHQDPPAIFHREDPIVEPPTPLSYLANFATILEVTLTKPKIKFGRHPGGWPKDDRLTARLNQIYTDGKRDTNLFIYIIVNILFGLAVQSRIPNLLPQRDVWIVVSSTLVFWMFWSIIFYWIQIMMGFKENLMEVTLRTLRVLSTVYVSASVVMAFVKIVLDVNNVVIIYFIAQFILLCFYLFLAHKRQSVFFNIATLLYILLFSAFNMASFARIQLMLGPGPTTSAKLEVIATTKSLTVTSIVLDNQDTIWFGTEEAQEKGALYRINQDPAGTWAITRVLALEYPVTELIIDCRDNVWVALKNLGVQVYHSPTQQATILTPAATNDFLATQGQKSGWMPSKTILAMASTPCSGMAPEVHVWLGFANGGVRRLAYKGEYPRLEEGNLRLEQDPALVSLHDPTDNTRELISTDLLYTGNKLWIATTRGLWLLSNPITGTLALQQFGPTARVLSLASDESGTLWAGTSQSLIKTNGTPGQTIVYSRTNTLFDKESSLRPVAVYANDVWIGSYCNEKDLCWPLSIFTKGGTLEAFPQPVSFKQVRKLLVDRKNRLWIVTEQGIIVCTN